MLSQHPISLSRGYVLQSLQSIRDRPVTALRCKDISVGSLAYPYNLVELGAWLNEYVEWLRLICVRSGEKM